MRDFPVLSLSVAVVMELSALDVAVYTSILLLFRWIHTRRVKNELPYPPGPRGLPIVGNIMDVPANPAWYTYIRWGKDYSESLFALAG